MQAGGRAGLLEGLLVVLLKGLHGRGALGILRLTPEGDRDYLLMRNLLGWLETRLRLG